MTVHDSTSDLAIETPIVVLSDLHLGHPASFIRDPAQIMPLLATAKTVIFNGDTFEQLHFGRRARARELLHRLLSLCQDRGVRPIMLTGNHDPRASSAHYLDLFGGRVFLTHGDSLHEAIAPWSRECPAVIQERRRLEKILGMPEGIDDDVVMTKRTELVAALYDHDAPAGRLAQLYMVGKFALMPWRVLIALRYWASVVHLCHQFSEKHRRTARLFLFGHTHRPGVWMGRGMTVVNTGSFHPLSRPLVVRLTEHRATVHRTKFTNHSYHLAEELHHIELGD